MHPVPSALPAVRRRGLPVGLGVLGWLVPLAITLAVAAPAPAPPPPLPSRPPLAPRDYLDLPLGAIRPAGWLRLQLERMRSGLTGTLDRDYPAVVGPRNGWLGGDGDGWERGPYWIDGLLPLAWQLDDPALKAKAGAWVEWTLTHQQPSGSIGPLPFERPPDPEPGLQKTPREDWWPRMVMLKVLQQHHAATGDPRVVEVLLRYFRFQLRELPRTPLDHWSFWANQRAADNLMVVHWLYDLTGEAFLLELGDLLHRQTYPWTEILSNRTPDPSPDLAHLYPANVGNTYPFNAALIRRLSVDQLQSFHCVNLAQGIKSPIIYARQDRNPARLAAVKTGLATLRQFHGQPQGMFGGDEPLHGRDPTQGVELCSVVELMFSHERMLALTGDLEFADALEWIAYNALPAQTTPDFRRRQYFQSANQVLCSRARRNFYEDDHHHGTDSVFGVLTGYPCCTCNLHQGWPKLVQHLWFATRDGGLAALVYGPSTVRATAGGVTVEINEETRFPFENSVRFVVRPERAVEFPLHLRVPAWATGMTATLNGTALRPEVSERLWVLRRRWEPGDQLTLHFGAATSVSRWVENSVAVQSGPLLYALRIEEQWREVEATDSYGPYLEVHPGSPWNYGLLEAAVANPAQGFTVHRETPADDYPWSQAGAPVSLRVAAKRIPEWTLYGHRAGPLPHSRPSTHLADQPAETVVLLPYGCTRLRITEFPVVR